MNTWKKLTLFSLLATPLVPTWTIAQDETDINFVRDWMGFRVVPEFAPNPNNIEVFNDYCIDFQEDPGTFGGTCGTKSPYGLEYEAFLQQLSEAYAEGRGGVINFETPILGPAYRAKDRRGHRAFIEQFALDNPFEDYEAQVRQDFPDLGDADVLAFTSKLQQEEGYAAAEAALFDPASPEIPVVARIDRGLDDTVDNPISENLVPASIIGFYGPDEDVPLFIRRGDQSYTEAALATRNFPGPWDLKAMFNGEFFTNVGISSYAGGSYGPVSGINTFNGGMHDMVFDPRDNVTAVGFVFLTFGNFQYYQGPNFPPTPNNPNNMRVYVEFSNGEAEELAQTSDQQSGIYDVFFGIQAPEGASITRIWLRVIGQNFRTFVSIDDLAFITEPSLAYIASDTVFTGSQGAEFYSILETGQSPESVTITDLPPGISYDAETRLISGTFSAAGSYSATVTLVNSVGTSEETLTFEVVPAGDPDSYLKLNPVDPVKVVLRRNLPETVVTSNLDDTLPLGSIIYFADVVKVLEDGSTTATSLDRLGLTLRDNTILGKPGAASQIGKYEVTIYGREENSASRTTFDLEILAPTASPNFDANGTTDFGVLSGGQLYTAMNLQNPGSFGTVSLQSRLSGIPSGAQVFTGDFNGDIKTDLLVWDAAAGTVRQYLADEDGFTESVLLEGIDPATGEEIIAVADYNGDGNSDIFWNNASRNRLTIWLMKNGAISWAGPLAKENGLGSLILTSDFAGDGSLMHLYESGSGLYSLEQYTTFTTLGEIQYETIDFTKDDSYEPVLSADFSNDGRADILWSDPATGESRLWMMQGLSATASYFKALAEDEEPDPTIPSTGLKGQLLLPAGFNFSVVAAADLNNDQFADLVLRDRLSGRLALLYLQGTSSKGTILELGDAQTQLLAVGDYDGDARNDLLLLNSATNALTIRAIADDGTQTSVPYGTNPAGATWLTKTAINNTASPIDISFDWLGDYSFVNNVWLYAMDWGYLAPVAIDPSSNSGWFYDTKLGYIWSSAQYFPNVFQARSGFWLQYVVGSQNPKWFFNHIFGFYMTENEL